MYQALKRKKVKFGHINITHPSISLRCNPLDPVYLPFKLYSQEYAGSILKNLNRSWITKSDFWSDNAISFLGAVIWFLKKHHPSCCSLPHAMLICLQSHSKSISLLNTDLETGMMISSISSAYVNNAEKQLAGVFSSLQLPLNKIYTKEIFWVLSGQKEDHDYVDLDVSHPSNPIMLTVANDPRLSDSLSPIVSLIGSVCMKNMNQQGKNRSIFMLDEAPTLFIPGLENLPATARSNNLCTVICVQDFSQLQSLYGDNLAGVIRNNLGNQFFGMTGNLDTGSYVSKLAGEYTHFQTSLHVSGDFFNEKISKTTTLGKEQYLPPSLLSRQSPGSFVVKVAGSRPKFLSTSLKGVGYVKKLPPLPVYHPGDLRIKLDSNWVKIHNEVEALFKTYGISL